MGYEAARCCRRCFHMICFADSSSILVPGGRLTATMKSRCFPMGTPWACDADEYFRLCLGQLPKALVTG